MAKVFSGRTKSTKPEVLESQTMRVDEAVVYARAKTGDQYTREFLYDAIAAGRLIAVRPVVGRGFRIRLDALDAFIVECQAGRVDRGELRAARSGKFPSVVARQKRDPKN